MKALIWTTSFSCCLAICLALTFPVNAQESGGAFGNDGQAAKPVPTRNDPSRDGGMQMSGRYQLVKGTNRGFLILKVQVPKGSYTYSVSQPKGGPPATRIQAQPAKSYRVVGKFTADSKPEIVERDKIFDIRIEKHRDVVQFFVPIEIHPDLKPEQVRPVMKFDGQLCSDQGICIQVRNRQIAAEFAGFYEQQANKKSTGQGAKR